eukprot:scaffold142510_cov21-Tisochrysis_lutea.AAC.1
MQATALSFGNDRQKAHAWPGLCISSAWLFGMQAKALPVWQQAAKSTHPVCIVLQQHMAVWHSSNSIVCLFGMHANNNTARVATTSNKHAPAPHCVPAAHGCRQQALLCVGASHPVMKYTRQHNSTACWACNTCLPWVQNTTVAGIPLCTVGQGQGGDQGREGLWLAYLESCISGGKQRGDENLRMNKQCWRVNKADTLVYSRCPGPRLPQRYSLQGPQASFINILAWFFHVLKACRTGPAWRDLQSSAGNALHDPVSLPARQASTCLALASI